jgi:hypothetical protein
MYCADAPHPLKGCCRAKLWHFLFCCNGIILSKRASYTHRQRTYFNEAGLEIMTPSVTAVRDANQPSIPET